MIDVTQKEIMPGVRLTAVHTSKFKSSCLGIQMLVPISAQTASSTALLPMVLRRGTERCPNMVELSSALDELYGGSIEPMVRKKGEIQCVGFTGSFLDDAYTPDGSAVLESAAALMGDLLLHPATENGGFIPAYVEGEQANLIDRIRAQINDKRQYAVLRLVQLMCRDEAYGVDRLGDESGAAAITGKSLWNRYQKMLSDSRIELYFSGSAPFERVERAFCTALKDLKRTGGCADALAGSDVRPGRSGSEPHFYEDRLDVTQGKLTLGFRTGGLCVSDDLPSLMLLNAVYGGTTTSKLFLNVREKLSLCYYASSQIEKFKGLLLVSSGVEFEKRQEAQDEILAQLDACRDGKLESPELEAAARSVMGSLGTLVDSQYRLEDFWLGQSAAWLSETPEELAARIGQVTPEEVAAAAKRLELDSVYFLRGKEEGN